MKITGARSESFSAIRKRAPAQAGAQTSANAGSPVDQAAFLGLGEADLTPAVLAAMKTLLTELAELRGEVSRLKARLVEVEGLADRDALTPLLNRRAFVRELSRVRTFSQRYGSPASLVYFDVDGFKGVNDRYGHAAGDACLHAMSERLTSNVRESDIVGRMGGDEFAVILVQTDQATAATKAAGLAEAIGRTPVEFGEWSALLQVSYGVSEISADMDPEALIAGADAAMFAHKRERRSAHGS